jgi:serine/threonine-protein kinase HipA
VHNEEFFMKVARSCGLDVAPTHLVEDRNGEPGLLVQRFDRVKQGGKVHKLHVEDACQLVDAVPARKYDLSVREIAEALERVCSAPKVEVLRLIERYVFSYLIGNGDLHAKNISVLWNGIVRLSPAYDLLSTLPYGLDRWMALKIDGKNDRFRAADFVRFAATFGVPERAVLHSISRIRAKAAPWMDRLEEIGFSSRVTATLRRAITERGARLAT